jgi:hypothetical protein
MSREIREKWQAIFVLAIILGLIGYFQGKDAVVITFLSILWSKIDDIDTKTKTL